jgi:threonine/homoserine efflux transporter RhtA
VCLIDGPLFSSRVNSRCPAVIFAVQRTANVPGRIKLLIVSMTTINGINTVGVPCGTKCSNMWLVFLIQPNNINLIHRGRARVSVSVNSVYCV